MCKKQPLKIGVLSDTHLPYRLKMLPPEIMQIFASVDLIIHAGDVDEIDLLHPLKAIAPVYAVRGNIHLGDRSWGGRDLPAEVQLTLCNRKVLVQHGHRQGVVGGLLKIPEIARSIFSQSTAKKENERIANRLANAHPDADIIIFGHSHAPYCQVHGNTLFFNPGAVAPTHKKWNSVGLINLWLDRIESEIVPLGDNKQQQLRSGQSFRQIHRW